MISLDVKFFAVLYFLTICSVLHIIWFAWISAATLFIRFVPSTARAYFTCEVIYFDQLPKNVHRLRMLEQLLADECRCQRVSCRFYQFTAANLFLRLSFLPRSLWQLPHLQVALTGTRSMLLSEIT